jgi:GntR family transcriptional regulator, carbon starvation induced regulator
MILFFMHKITVSSLVPISLTEQAFRKLRQDVLVGTFAAGAKLKLEELQAHYQFSSSPLREALSRLAQEGLVRADERRGFRVAPISLEDLSDITHMRLTLDIPALRSAIAHGDDAWEAAIVAAFHRLEKVESRLSDAPVVLDQEWSELHRTFHLALIAACSSKRQVAWSTSLFDQAERYRRLSARQRQMNRRKSTEHRKLMDASLRRDADTAAALLSEHILSTQRNVEAAMLRAPNIPG